MKELILMIGASGSGKSSLRKILIEENSELQAYSWDELRLEYSAGKIANWSDLDNVERARQAFALTTEESGPFANFNQTRFMSLLKNGSVLVDNTNTSVKRRSFFIDQARAKGYKIIAYLFPITRAELIRRARTRTDHKVPIANILQQWASIQLPGIGEVDEIRFIFDQAVQ